MASSLEAFQKVSRNATDCDRASDSCRSLRPISAQETAETLARRSRTASSTKEPLRITST
jgi:hypothetical protein